MSRLNTVMLIIFCFSPFLLVAQSEMLENTYQRLRDRLGDRSLTKEEKQASIDSVLFLIKSSNETVNKPRIGQSYHLMAVYYGKSYMDDSASKYYAKALTVYEQQEQLSADQQMDLAKLYNNYSKLLYRKEELSSALNLAKKSLTIRESLPGNPNVEVVHWHLAMISDRLQDYQQAVDYYDLALPVYEKDSSRRKYAGTLHNNLCSAYGKLRDLSKAQFHAQRALEIAADTNILLIFLTNYHLGNVYFFNENYSQALTLYQDCAAILEDWPQKFENHPGPVNVHNALGLTFVKLNDQDAALKAFLRAHSLIHDFLPQKQQFEVLDNIADTYMLKKQPAAAAKYFEAAIVLQNQIRARRDSMMAHGSSYLLDIVSAQVKNNKQEQTLNQQKLSIQYLISGLLAAALLIGLLFLFQQRQKQRYLQELTETRHRAETRVGEAIVEIYKEEQAYQMEEREDLGTYLHDSVQGALYACQLYLNSFKEHLNDNVKMQNRVHDFIKSLKHETDKVMNVSRKLKEGIAYEHGYTGQFLDNLNKVLSLYESSNLFEELTITIDNEIKKLDELPLVEAATLKNAILRWIQSSFTNIIKHSKAARVQFEAKLENERFLMQIQDNGIGVKPDWQNWIAETNGLLHMKEEVESYEGTFDIRSQGGTEVVISIPLKMTSEE